MAHSNNPLIIIAVGEPKLDYYAEVSSTEILSLGLNNSADNYYTSEQLEMIKNNLNIDDISIGGSVTNTINLLAKLGRQSHLLGYKADDQNDLIARTLDAQETISWLFNSNKIGKGNLLVIVNKNTGERTFVNADYSGVEQLPAIKLNEQQKEIIQKSALIILEGYDWLLPQKLDIHLELMNIKGKETTVALSLSDISVIHKRHVVMIPFIISHVDFLFGNETEIETLISHACDKDISFKDISINDISTLLDTHFPNTTIFMSHGDNGGYCFANNAALHVPCDKIDSKNIVNTNGAGDCFMAGVLDCYLDGDDQWIERGLIKGTQLGTACIQSKTTLPDNAFIKKLTP